MLASFILYRISFLFFSSQHHADTLKTKRKTALRGRIVPAQFTFTFIHFIIFSSQNRVLLVVS